MKVNILNPPGTMPFHTLENGVVFFSNNVYYLKTQLITDDPYKYNAVSIVSGIHCYFEKNHHVIPVDGEFVAKKKEANA